MAEGPSFDISIPVRADFTPFHAEAKAELDRVVARGVTIPVHAGTAGRGGQYESPGVRVTAAEQRAVDQAYSQAMGRSHASAGGYHAGAYAGGGQSIRLDTSEYQMGMRRVQGIGETVRRDLERPIKIRVDTSEADAAMARLRVMPVAAAGAGAGGVARGGGVDPRVAARVDRNWEDASFAQFLTREGRVPPGTLAMTAGVGDEMSRYHANYAMAKADRAQHLSQYMNRPPASTVAAMAAMAAANPGAAQDRRRSPDQRERKGPPLLGGGQFGVPTSSIRGLAGFIGIMELGNAFAATRTGDAAESMARTPEAAAVAREEALVQATAGVFGSILTFIPDALDSERWSPQRRARDARRELELRNRRNEQKQAFASRMSERRQLQAGVESVRGETSALGYRGWQRQWAGIQNQLGEDLQGLRDDLAARRDAINAAPDDIARNNLAVAFNDRVNRIPAMEDALRSRAAAQQREVTRHAMMRYRSASRRIPGLQAAAEGQVGLAAQRDFEAGLSDAVDAADVEGSEFGQLARREKLLAMQARKAETMSRVHPGGRKRRHSPRDARGGITMLRISNSRINDASH